MRELFPARLPARKENNQNTKETETVRNVKNTSTPWAAGSLLQLLGVESYFRDESILSPGTLSLLRHHVATCWYAVDLVQRWSKRTPKALRPLCGARTRRGGHCQARAVNGRKRCRLHGGASTGPRTKEGRENIVRSNQRRRKKPREIDILPDYARKQLNAGLVARGLEPLRWVTGNPDYCG